MVHPERQKVVVRLNLGRRHCLDFNAKDLNHNKNIFTLQINMFLLYRIRPGELVVHLATPARIARAPGHNGGTDVDERRDPSYLADDINQVLYFVRVTANRAYRTRPVLSNPRAPFFRQA